MVTTARDEIRRILEEAKSQPCADCDTQFHLAAMQFDHVKGDKKFNLASATAQSPNIEALKEEIAKCEIVCANCHSVRTHNRGYFNRHLASEDDSVRLAE
jgi:hypothetical protein